MPSSLHCACLAGDLDSVVSLLSQVGGGSDVNEEILCDDKYELTIASSTGGTPLRSACLSGNTSVVSFLIDSGASLELADSEGRTPMYVASMYGHVGVVSLLADRGADLDAKTLEGGTPLLVATERELLDVVKALIDKGAKVNYRPNNNAEIPLLVACLKMHAGIVELLLKSGADVLLCNALGLFPLLVVSDNDDPRSAEIAQLLLDRGAEVDAKSPEGVTPLFAACGKKNADVVDVLLAGGGNPNITLKGTWEYAGEDLSLLTVVTQLGNTRILSALLAAGADADPPPDGMNLLELATSSGHLNCRLVLEEHFAAQEKKKTADTEKKKVEMAKAAEAADKVAMELLESEGAEGVNDKLKSKSIIPKKKKGKKKEESAAVTKPPSRQWPLDTETNIQFFNKLKQYEFLSTICEGNNLARMQEMFKKGLVNDINVAVGGVFPLCGACCSGNMDTVKWLMKIGANVLVQPKMNEEGLTMLHQTAAYGHPTIVSLLIDKGFSVDQASSKGLSPLMVVCMSKPPVPGVYQSFPHPTHLQLLEVCEVLLARGAKVKAEHVAAAKGSGLVHIAARLENHLETVAAAAAQADAAANELLELEDAKPSKNPKKKEKAKAKEKKKTIPQEETSLPPPPTPSLPSLPAAPPQGDAWELFLASLRLDELAASAAPTTST